MSFRRLIIALALSIVPATTLAQQPCQTISLMTCQVNMTNNSMAHIQHSAPWVSVKTAGTGSVNLFCPLTNNALVDSFSSDDADHWGHWTLVAHDPDASGLQHDIVAQLFAYSRAGNGSDVIATISSSISSGTSIGSAELYSENIDGYTFDFIGHDYLIEIGIHRMDAGAFARGRSLQFCAGKN